MSKSDAPGDKAIMRELTDPSLEFDVFEMARQRLVEVFIGQGHERLEAERIAVYVIEGLQHVPKLLNVLTRIKLPEQTEILEALGPVLDESGALDKARRMLLQEDGGQEQNSDA